ncbi:MAG: aspartate 1-decarboxylase [Actinobacteria bacterium]|nr:MAG: aspartate 1-decarboxylase [Actinomycetota bacterium]
MRRKMLHGKIHRATITGADVSYEGSVTIDAALMDAADILPNEAVAIWDVDNGARFETYAIPGMPGSGVVCVNGAAARLVSVGDRVIVAHFSEMDDAEARAHEPHVVFVDERNHPVECRAEHGGQAEVRRLPL